MELIFSKYFRPRRSHFNWIFRFSLQLFASDFYLNAQLFEARDRFVPPFYTIPAGFSVPMLYVLLSLQFVPDRNLFWQIRCDVVDPPDKRLLFVVPDLCSILWGAMFASLELPVIFCQLKNGGWGRSTFLTLKYWQNRRAKNGQYLLDLRRLKNDFYNAESDNKIIGV